MTGDAKMKIAYRKFACDKCGAIHEIQTNHKGQVYSQKCQNWPCTAGCFDFTPMTFWGGKVELKEMGFYERAGDLEKAKLFFKVVDNGGRENEK